MQQHVHQSMKGAVFSRILNWNITATVVIKRWTLTFNYCAKQNVQSSVTHAALGMMKAARGPQQLTNIAVSQCFLRVVAGAQRTQIGRSPSYQIVAMSEH